jgi:hypothetical protein
MYASIDFTSKTELRRAIQQGQTVVAYSPTLGMAAVTGRTMIEGPWKPDRKARGWHACVDVKDVRIVAVH